MSRQSRLWGLRDAWPPPSTKANEGASPLDLPPRFVRECAATARAVCSLLGVRLLRLDDQVRRIVAAAVRLAKRSFITHEHGVERHDRRSHLLP